MMAANSRPMTNTGLRHLRQNVEKSRGLRKNVDSRHATANLGVREWRKATPHGRFGFMCRNIKTLFNFDPPVTEDEVRAASLQFVRKITGFNKPSKANEAAFLTAVENVAALSSRLLRSLETTAPPKNREEEAAKAKARAAERFGT